MFIAIIGTRLSGKSTVETYLTERGFIPVRVISRTPGHEERAQARPEVSPSRLRHLVQPVRPFLGYPEESRPSIFFHRRRRRKFRYDCRLEPSQLLSSRRGLSSESQTILELVFIPRRIHRTLADISISSIPGKARGN